MATSDQDYLAFLEDFLRQTALVPVDGLTPIDHLI